MSDTEHDAIACEKEAKCSPAFKLENDVLFGLLHDARLSSMGESGFGHAVSIGGRLARLGVICLQVPQPCLVFRKIAVWDTGEGTETPRLRSTRQRDSV
jgi:hypothetical protein